MSVSAGCGYICRISKVRCGYCTGSNGNVLRLDTARRDPGAVKRVRKQTRDTKGVSRFLLRALVIVGGAIAATATAWAVTSGTAGADPCSLA